MTQPVPDDVRIYHITHVDNLPGIVNAGVLWSDAKRLELGLTCALVGMSEIKQRRLMEVGVDCHPGTKVGEYVPFFFCPRSIMLYILHRGNRQGLTYQGGQAPLVHLEARVHDVVSWAKKHGVRWAFTNRNAATSYASFFNSLARLDEVNWQAVEALDFRDAVVKDGKQAEFLVFERLPWNLVSRVGVFDVETRQKATAVLSDQAHKPPVEIRPEWYF